MKNVETLSCDETINHLNRLIDNLDKWLELNHTPTQNTGMVETDTVTETDNAKDYELDTTIHMRVYLEKSCNSNSIVDVTVKGNSDV